MRGLVVLTAIALLLACGESRPDGPATVPASTEEPRPDGPGRTSGSPEPEPEPTPAAVQPEHLGRVVVEAHTRWVRHAEGEREVLPVDESPLTRWRLLTTGDVVYQREDNGSIMLLRVGRPEPRVLVERPVEPGRRISLAGTGTRDGRAVVLIADGTATSLNDDRGTDIVAVDPEDGARNVLVDDAANAWEGGVSLAAATGDWTVYHGFESTRGSITAVETATGTSQVLRDADPEEDALEYTGLQLVQTAGDVTVVLLTHHRAGFPDEPAANVEFMSVGGEQQQGLPVPGISWDEGLPWSLSVGDRFLVVNRREEQGGPTTALAYDLDEGVWYELERPGVLAVQ